MAANYDCYRCITAAVANQLVLTVPGEPGEEQLRALAGVWSRLIEFGRDISAYSLAEITEQLETFKSEITTILGGAPVITTQPSPTSSTDGGTSEPTSPADGSTTASPSPTSPAPDDRRPDDQLAVGADGVEHPDAHRGDDHDVAHDDRFLPGPDHHGLDDDVLAEQHADQHVQHHVDQHAFRLDEPVGDDVHGRVVGDQQHVAVSGTGQRGRTILYAARSMRHVRLRSGP